MQFEGLDHVVLRTNNLDAMLAFYQEALGCPFERSLPDIGLYQLRAGGSLIDIVPVDSELGRMGGAAPGSEGRNMDHFCLSLATFDEAAIRSTLLAHDIDAGDVQQRYGAKGSGPSLYINDPDGNVVELKGPPTEPAR